MVERYYDFAVVREKADCVQEVRELTEVNSQNRCRAVWRGGDGWNIALAKGGYCDHTKHKDDPEYKGDVIKIVALIKFGRKDNNTLQEAAQYLGDKLGLKPVGTLKKEERKFRTMHLQKSGYKLINTYIYKDEWGNPRHSVERWEHPEKKKEFIQKDAKGNESLKGVDTVLYRLPEWILKSEICLVEGEKDADNLWKIGIPATTNASGAGTWKESYTKALAKKVIVIIADNDDAGNKRGKFLLNELKGVANSLKLISFPGESKGFDVSDYLEKYGADKFRELILNTPVIEKETIKQPNEDYLALQQAKEANQEDFCNYILFKHKDESGKDKTVEKPKQINDLIEECHKRFMGFPRQIGELLFDHDRDTGEIEYFRDPERVFAWMMRKSKKNINWKGGSGYVNKKEFFGGIVQAAKRYEEISYAPTYPDRDDIYNAYPALPEPHPDRKYLYDFVSFFNPDNRSYQILLCALIAAPLYYRREIPRPLWIIDSKTGAGAGKTTLAEQVARLYNNEEIQTNKYELNNRFESFTGRVLSASGRSARVILLDNITGDFECERLSDLVTHSSISGKSPYARGEENRPNNLTYIITANSATVDPDIAIRSYYIHLKHASGGYSSAWKSKVINYREKYRYHIIADIIDTLKSNEPFECEPCTRFPEFEKEIVQAFCGDLGEYSELVKTIKEVQAEINVGQEHAEMIEDAFESELIQLNADPKQCYFIRMDVTKKWFKKILPEWRINPSHYLKNLARQGLFKNIDSTIFRKQNKRGILWGSDSQNGFLIVEILSGGKVGIRSK